MSAAGIIVGIVWLIIGSVIRSGVKENAENIANTIKNPSAGDSIAMFMALTGVPFILIIVSIAPYVIKIFRNLRGQ